MDLINPYLHFDSGRNSEFVDLSLITLMCPTPTNPNFARTITTWLKTVIPENCPDSLFEDIYLPKGVVESEDRVPQLSRHSMLRRDYFDLLICGSGPQALKQLKLSWTPSRVRYVQFAYPTFPIPGISQGNPCRSDQQRQQIMTAVMTVMTAVMTATQG